MKIVFWGGEEACGTTSNMAAVAGMLAAKSGRRIAVLSAWKNGADITKSFSGAGQRGTALAEDCAYYALDGLDYLFNAAKYGALTEKHVRDAMRPFADGKLLGLAQGARALCGYYPKRVQSVLGQTIGLLDAVADISLIDLGCGRDDWTYARMKEADMVVVNLKQSAEAFDRFFGGERKITGKSAFCVGSYQRDSVYNRKNLNRIYRIAPERLCAVPYNPEFEMACREGKSDKYMKGRKSLRRTEMRRYFFCEVERTVRILTGELGNGDDETGVCGAGKPPRQPDFKEQPL